MALLDHFHPPLSQRRHWDSFHGAWAEAIALELSSRTSDFREGLAAFKERRDQAGVEARLEELRGVARGEGNLLHPIRAALAADASIGEVCGAMREVFGEYRGGSFF